MSDLITIEPGPPVRIEISPPTAALAVQEGTQFTAVARDEFGNVVPSTFDWATKGEGGSITENGLFTAGTVAGAFTDTVAASLQRESGELVGSASITVEPGPLSRVVVEPAEVTLDIGATRSFSFSAFDAFDNETTDVIATWTVPPDLGSIDANGTLTTGTKAGSFFSAVHLEAVEGTTRVSASVDVVILPDPLNAIEMHPDFVVVEKSGTQQFEATGVDQYGNKIPELAVQWDATGGEITREGIFTAGGESGSYEVNATATFKDSTQRGAAIVPVPPVWIPAGDMLAARAGHTATLLPDGKVPVVGGANSAELYDPATRSFSTTGGSSCDYGEYSAGTVLGDGRVLMTGGNDNWRCAEVYDPHTGVFSRMGDMNVDHTYHTATLLPDGRVLIAGGYERQYSGRIEHAVAEIYDPVTEAFSITGSLTLERSRHTATLLPSGAVLITGGVNISFGCVTFAELYDPATKTFSLIRGPKTTKCSHTATLLNSGNVLITENDRMGFLFDPVTGTFRATGITTSRGEHTPTLLPAGEVLITGGWIPGTLPVPEGVENLISLATAEIYDPATETFTAIANMNHPRGSHTATLLPNGHVLVVGGSFALTTLTGEIVTHRTLASSELLIPSNSQ